MNLAIWDIESSSANTSWGSIIEVGGILVDPNFKELDRFNFRCRLPEGEIPQCMALIVNRTSVDLLTKGNLSHYEMLGQLEATFKKWSPAMFMGWSNIGFDDEMIRNEFFRGIRYPYITNATPNKRHDGLNIARGAHAVDESVVKTEINAKGNAVMKLESLARMNGFESSGAHSALYDADLTAKVLGLIKKNQPQTWDIFLRTANRSDTEAIVKKEKMFTLAEYHFGKNYKFVVAPLHPKYCIDSYNWGRAVDLKVDPIPLFDMSISELKSAIKKLKFLRTIRSNKAPIILNASYGLQVEPYSNLDPDLIKERAKLVNSNEKFAQNILTALRETAEEKAQFDSQEDVPAEETIYKKFTPQKDTALFPKWHAASWKDKLILLDKFEDERMVSFGKKIIYQESPETLPADMFKTIKRGIAERILSDEKEKWWTCKEFYFECDNLRDRYTNEKDEKKLKFLDEINEFVEGIQKKYEQA
ncbi:exonuclease domain-containing protein [Candidatus Pelagibacter sp.]|nr:exonuclease domain-containing protein [Candidatus Pelagibacter sp.]MDC1483228.1 exonuclease domain-containing protein [Pelagibacteraceae bacterium]